MKVLLFGAAGAIGRPLIRLLREHGHDVVGTTRNGSRADAVRALGAEPVVCDAFDADAVREAVARHAPDVIVNQLTALTAPLNPRRYEEWLAPTNRLRREGTRNLAAAAASAGVPRLLSQSIAFAYRWDAPGLRSETDPLFDARMGFGDAVGALDTLERLTLGTPGVTGTVLRYGYFYGPGTSYARGGEFAEMVGRRRLPIVGPGTGRIPFVHVDDAAAATVEALERGAEGVFNIVDDDAAVMHEWLPAFAAMLGVRAPRRVPVWLARLATNRFLAEAAVRMPGADNTRARSELGWTPRFPSWREGFAHEFGGGDG